MSAMQWPFAHRFQGQRAQVDDRTTRTVTIAAFVSVVGALVIHFTSARVISIWLPVAVLLGAALALAMAKKGLEKGRRVNIRAAQAAAIIAVLAVIFPGASLMLGPTAFIGIWLIASGAFGADVSILGRTFSSTIPGFMVIILGALVQTYSFEAAIRGLWFFG